MEDIEVVYPDVIFGGDGDVKVDPVHIFVPDIFADLPGINRDKVFKDCYICILTTLCYTYISENIQHKF